MNDLYDLGPQIIHMRMICQMLSMLVYILYCCNKIVAVGINICMHVYVIVAWMPVLIQALIHQLINLLMYSLRNEYFDQLMME